MNNANAELIWVKDERAFQPMPLLRIKDPMGPQEATTTVYEGRLQPCGDPLCRCGAVRVAYSSAPADGNSPGSNEPGTFWLDLLGHHMLAEEGGDELSNRLGKAAEAVLKEEDWTSLMSWFRSQKLQWLTGPGGLDDITLAKLPEPGDKMMPFLEVFPWALDLQIALDGEVWLADGHFCTRAECTCTQTIITFFKLRDRTGPISSPEDTRDLMFYDYKTGKLRVETRSSRGSPAVELLFAKLKDTYPNLNLVLKMRHLILQNLYLRRDSKRLEQERSSLAHIVGQKIGRNEPCFCGSGKKYKHCCLR